MENKDNKPIHCVFVHRKFATMFPNFDSYYRKGVTEEGVIFDCISVSPLPNYLDIVATALDSLLPNLHILIPISFVQAVLLDSQDKVQMGFVQKPQDSNGQDQSDPSP